VSNIKHLIELVKESNCASIEDDTGTIWTLGKWYGGTPHFRSNLGHWSEDVLELWIIESREFKTYNVDPEKISKDSEDWYKFYTQSISSKKEDVNE
jgi:hypothetical protein